MESYTEKEPTNDIHKSSVTEEPLDLESIKYDDKRLQDPMFCKRVAAALEKYLTDDESLPGR